MVNQACRDYFTKRDFLTQLDAALWLRGEGQYFLELLDLAAVDIMRILRSPTKPKNFIARRS
jgi:hypothetical protein